MRARRRKAKPKKKNYAEAQKRELAILRKERQALKAKKLKENKKSKGY